jgi:hypothetical protein
VRRRQQVHGRLYARHPGGGRTGAWSLSRPSRNNLTVTQESV